MLSKFKTQFFIVLLGLLLVIPANARIGNTRAQNKAQYGQEISVEPFDASATSFSGYISYSMDKDWKLKAFYRNDEVRNEHLVPKNLSASPILTRSEVRVWAEKMFAQSKRGTYQKKMAQHRAEGHFFSKGLVAYEYSIEGKATKGYNGVKVLLYENNKSYWSINPKAYL